MRISMNFQLSGGHQYCFDTTRAVADTVELCLLVLIPCFLWDDLTLHFGSLPTVSII